jgi:hypothetical protein
MTTRELTHVTKVTNLLDAAAYTATQTSAALDTQGWESAAIAFVVGVWTSGTFTPSLTESTTSGGTYTAVDPTQVEWWLNGVYQGATIPVVSSAATDQTIIVASYVGGTKRFIKGVATGATTPSAVLGIIGIQGHPRESI